MVHPSIIFCDKFIPINEDKDYENCKYQIALSTNMELMFDEVSLYIV